jgi:hypothetical protein
MDSVAVVGFRDLLTRTLAPVNPGDRASFVLRDRGWSPTEITQVLASGGTRLTPG